MRVGVLSDTHGSLPAAVHDVFRGVASILHAGDVGPATVLDELGAIAPVIAVRGNCDHDSMGGRLEPLVNTVFGGVRVLVVHRAADVPRPLPPGVGVVVTGHTHRALVEERDGVLWLNPGSAARSRGGGHTVAVLTLGEGAPRAAIVPLP